MFATATLIVTFALVVEDQTPLLAASKDSAARKAVLTRGDSLEVRGASGPYLAVYDHRRERPGYVRATQVRAYPLSSESAPPLRAVLEFLKDAPTQESLGIGYAALYLRASSGREEAAVLSALGTMADRLARRASLRRTGPFATQAAAQVAAQLEVAESYGVRFHHSLGEENATVCYDGDAFRRVLGISATPMETAKAALFLTQPSCKEGDEKDKLQMVEEATLESQLSILEKVPKDGVLPYVENRVRLRRAGIYAGLSYKKARQEKWTEAAALSEKALSQLALVSRQDLLEEDQSTYEEAALRVAALRFAGEAPLPPRPSAPTLLRSSPKEGEHAGATCLKLVLHKEVLQERCTYGLVWPSSLRVSPSGTVVTLSVQPLASWVELWVFRKDPKRGSWELTTLPPAPMDPGVGYTELAGFSPDSGKILVARESMAGGIHKRSFQVLRTDTLEVEKQARNPELLVSFRSYASAHWKGRTLSLR